MLTDVNENFIAGLFHLILEIVFVVVEILAGAAAIILIVFLLVYIAQRLSRQ